MVVPAGSPDAIWRPATLDDVPQLMTVADHIHPDLPEDASIYAERISLFPKGCHILARPETPTTKASCLGYLISHPIRSAQPPKLNALLGSIPSDADQYYIHDLALMPETRGQGHAAAVIASLLGDVGPVRSYRTTCLVSVYGTASFWGRFGFAESEVSDPGLAKKLQGYGKDAKFMVRQNAPRSAES